MAQDNEMRVTGNITRDPELRFTRSGGIAVANFAVAWNKRFQTEGGEWDSEPHFIDVTVWRELAENCAASLRKGDRVTVVGHFEQETWQDDNGQNRSKIKLIADEVGPSLRWAQVPDIEKNEKQERGGRGGGRSSGGGGGGRQSSGGGRSSGGRGGGASRPAPTPEPGFEGGFGPEPGFDDEEPFLADAGAWSPAMGFGEPPERMLT